MLPMVASAVPLLRIVNPPWTEKVVPPSDLMALTVHVTLPVPLRTVLAVTSFVSVQRLLWV